MNCDRHKVAIANLLILLTQVWRRLHVLQMYRPTVSQSILGGDPVGIVMLWSTITEEFNPRSCNGTQQSAPSQAAV